MVIDVDTNRRMLEKIRRNEQNFAILMALFSMASLVFIAIDDTIGLVSGQALLLNAMMWGFKSRY